MGQVNQSTIIFSEHHYKAVLGEISHLAFEIKEGISKSHKELLKKDIQFAVKRPENQIMNLLIFLQLQILKNKYPNKQNSKEFNKTLRRAFGLAYFILLKSELNKYQKLFDKSIEIGFVNPLQEICLNLYNTLTRTNSHAVLEANILSVYFANVGDLWDLVERAFYNNQDR